MSFGEKLSKLRKKMGLSQEDILFNVKVKIYISKENYEKIIKNHKSYEQSNEYNWCNYE